MPQSPVPPSPPHPAPRRRRARGGAALVLLVAAGCEALDDLPGRLLDHRTARERYEASLDLAGLSGTALAADWLAAARRALAEAPAVGAAHREEGYLPPSEPTAVAYRVQVRRGQLVTLEFDLPGDSTTTVFLDAWQVEGDSAPSYRHVESADSGRRILEFEPRRDGDYILRAQPELLRGGRFSVSVRLAPTLAFPVSGRFESDVGSRFGAERDGGARSHHGIDIFAPRGTPVIAARPGVVRRVEETPRGGKVVWLTDDLGNRLYYAHLHTQSVAGGQQVEAGDTLGTVGNTGNAITTPPHLHFGVYRRGEGPVDPWWFVHRPRVSLPRLAADTARLGEWIRTVADGAELLSSPESRTGTATLPRHTAVRVVAAVGSWYRVRLPDGTTGYLVARQAEAADEAVGSSTVAAGEAVLALPHAAPAHEAILAMTRATDAVDILGRFGSYLLIRTPDGTSGWVGSE